MADKDLLSYIHSPTVSPYMYETVPDRLRHLATVGPDKDAFIFYNQHKQRTSLTRKQLLDQSTKAAKILVKSGIKKGSSVAFCMSNSMELLVSNMGVIMAGGVPFYLSTNLKDGSDLVEFINNFGAEFLFMDTNVDDDNWRMLEMIWPSGEKRAATAPTLKMVICNGKKVRESETRKKLESFFRETPENGISLPDLQPEDALVIFCTSGSTGKPKGIIYTHFCALNWTKACDVVLNISENSVHFCDRSFCWVVGFPRTYLTKGTTRVFVDPKLSVSGKYTELICNIIKTERCDVVYLPGYMAVDVLKHPHLSVCFSSVKTLVMAGERIQRVTFRALENNFCKRVLCYYGTTETGGVCSFTGDSGDELEDGMIGKPFQGVEMKIVDELGEVVPVDTKGELCVRCAWRFAGYRDMEDMFREVVDNQNWFHTGDMAHFREDGNCVVDGRRKEMISTGTNKYFPWTIERALRNIQGAENVFAVGVPDPRLNQVVCACVLPKPGVPITEADVMKFCDETFLEESTSMVVSLKPRYYIILDKVPLTSSGKIDRRTIALQAKEKLGI